MFSISWYFRLNDGINFSLRGLFTKAVYVKETDDQAEKKKNLITITIGRADSKYEPPHDKTNKMACAASEDRSTWESAQSDQRLRCPNAESLGP